MLKELHAMTGRLERLAQAEHDLIRREVEPKVQQIKEHVESVRDAVSPEKTWPGSLQCVVPDELNTTNR